LDAAKSGRFGVLAAKTFHNSFFYGRTGRESGGIKLAFTVIASWLGSNVVRCGKDSSGTVRLVDDGTIMEPRKIFGLGW